MLVYPDINPIAFQLGPLAVHWYGLMYLIGFAFCWGVCALRLRYNTNYHQYLTLDQLSDLLFYVALGIIVGGRVGYMLFYDWQTLFTHPLQLFAIWQGGMSFHGGLLGVLIAVIIYSIKVKKHFLEITDFIAPAVPLGLAAGRIGNFINGELWGRVTDVPWAMLFPHAGNIPRHPSQLYEFLGEGILLFVILWLFSQKPKPCGAVSGLFLLIYGIIRFVIEFFREPDAQIGFIAFDWLTKGQLLCLPMIIIGIGMLIWSYKKRA